jgi:hypothetical protein
MDHFIDQISPLAITCFFEQLDSFLEKLKRFLVSGDEKLDWPIWQAPMDVRGKDFPPPRSGASKPRNFMMWSPRTNPELTAFYDNSRDGSSHFVRKLTLESGTACVSIRTTRPNEKWGVQELEYRAKNLDTYKSTRLLQWLEEEDGYRLYEEGVPLPFENKQIKLENRVVDRPAVLKLMRGFRIDLENGDFWKSDRDAFYFKEIWHPERLDDFWLTRDHSVPLIDLGRQETQSDKDAE